MIQIENIIALNNNTLVQNIIIKYYLNKYIM